MKHPTLLCASIMTIALGTVSFAQYRDIGFGGGIGFGGIIGQTDDLVNRESRFLARAYLRYGIVNGVQAEVGAGLGKLAGQNRKGNRQGTQDNSTALSELVPVDFRLLFSPFSFSGWNPYLYGGIGAVHYKMEEIPTNSDPNVKKSGWSGYAPCGIGVQIRMDDHTSFEVSGGYNFAFTDNINTITGASQINAKKNDAFWNFLVGLSVAGESGSADPDHDGLTNRQEEELGTNKKIADTDGDGLNDGDEVTKYKTDPLKADTDGDGLNDGDEVTKYRTDPLNADTDGGTVSDGQEVANNTNPLDANDDVPKKKEIKVEVGKAIVLEGIVFKTGSAAIGPASEEILEQAFNTLDQNKDVTVEIRGYTDNVGSRAANMRLSQRRADAVKAWLVKKGIAAERITTKGYGLDNPIADNKTPEGRQKNRRIEFFRTR